MSEIQRPYIQATTVMIGAVRCCATSIAGDNLQDLKAGYVLGATPRAQQIICWKFYKKISYINKSCV
jgi:uncharacterized oligopeptide transporter (OPT) family protein